MMRCALFLLLLGVVSASVSPTLPQLQSYSFESFERDYNKKYATVGERSKRASIFASNLALIIAHNTEYQLGRTSFFMDVNKFTDLTNDEFKTRLGRTTPSVRFSEAGLHTALSSHVPVQDLPESLDWRNKSGVVTPVKNLSLIHI